MWAYEYPLRRNARARDRVRSDAEEDITSVSARPTSTSRPCTATSRSSRRNKASGLRIGGSGGPPASTRPRLLGNRQAHLAIEARLGVQWLTSHKESREGKQSPVPASLRGLELFQDMSYRTHREALEIVGSGDCGQSRVDGSLNKSRTHRLEASAGAQSLLLAPRIYWRSCTAVVLMERMKEKMNYVFSCSNHGIRHGRNASVLDGRRQNGKDYPRE